ncbi:hypothetical protein KC19_1G073600 [Ceratodon purpureus]|uniref:Uncharacterized protein n=1 Tax=Ceratodon purpureus TaxID=3225 RepID=A0A8T0J5L7_CERPU|nr:hypothetical protein KC19_1G073600 [Ceratodon purpureus]
MPIPVSRAFPQISISQSCSSPLGHELDRRAMCDASACVHITTQITRHTRSALLPPKRFQMNPFTNQMPETHHNQGTRILLGSKKC